MKTEVGVESDIPEGFHRIESGFGMDIGYGLRFGGLYYKGELGTGTLAFRVLDHHANPENFCHGGALAFLADHQLAAVNRLLDEAYKHSPTVGLSIDYIAPIPLGAWLEMDVELIRTTKTKAYTHAILRVGNRVMARSSASYQIS